MIPINYRLGDATQPQTKGIKIIAHVCNDLGGWGKGFVLAISNRWTLPEQEYRRWHRQRASNDFELGAVQFVQVEPYIWIANMIGQRGMKTGSNGPPVRYEAISKCLVTVVFKANELSATIHMPRIGCGLSGGKWNKVEPLIESALAESAVEVFVYDYNS